jgi:hypothetical protein
MICLINLTLTSLFKLCPLLIITYSRLCIVLCDIGYNLHEVKIEIPIIYDKGGPPL